MCSLPYPFLRKVANVIMDSIGIYIENVSEEIRNYARLIDRVKITEAAKLVADVERNHGRIHVTGIGKPSHVAQYIAALFSSIGTPTYFLDGTEAIHGSAGQVDYGDVVIAISNSGKTEELKKAIITLKNNGAKIIGVSGGKDSWLFNNSDVFLYAGVNNEGDELNKPPRISILVEIFVLQCLSICIQKNNNLDLDTYYKWHPGGALGESIIKSKGVGSNES